VISASCVSQIIHEAVFKTDVLHLVQVVCQILPKCEGRRHDEVVVCLHTREIRFYTARLGLLIDKELFCSEGLQHTIYLGRQQEVIEGVEGAPTVTMRPPTRANQPPGILGRLHWERIPGMD
jgi:hypothetical protein